MLTDRDGRRALPSFLNFSHDADLLSRNKLIIFEGLTILSNADDGRTPETSVLVWGQIGRLMVRGTLGDALLTSKRVSVNQELNIVLLRLVEYLGFPNDLVIGAALNEVGS